MDAIVANDSSAFPLWQNWFVVPIAAFLFLWIINAGAIFTRAEWIERRIVTLRGSLFEGYRERLKDGLSGLSRWIGDDHPAGALHFSGSAFVTCLGIAVIYPVFFVVASWAALDGSATFAGLEILPRDATQAYKWALAAMMIGPIAITVGLRSFDLPAEFALGCALAFAFVAAVVFATIDGVELRTMGVLAWGTGFAIIVSLLLSGLRNGIATGIAGFAFAFSLAAAVEAAFVGSSAWAEAVAFEFVSTIVFVLVAAWLWIIANADTERQGWVMVFMFAPLLSVPALILAATNTLTQPLHIEGASLTAGSLVLFLALLPTVNAPFDWLSLGITRALVGLLASAPRGLLNILEIPVVGPLIEYFIELVVVIVDFCIALALAFLIVISTAGAAAILSKAHAWAHGTPLFDVVGTIDQIRANPWDARWWWIYAMMFWTLVPTLVHFVAFAGAVAASTLQPAAAWLGRQLESAFQTRSVASTIGASLLLTLLMLAPGGFALLLIYDYLPLILGSLGLDLATLGRWLADASEFVVRGIESK